MIGSELTLEAFNVVSRVGTDDAVFVSERFSGQSTAGQARKPLFSKASNSGRAESRRFEIDRDSHAPIKMLS